jgi:hypothetical protein
MTHGDSDDAYELILIRRRDLRHPGPRDRRELAAKAVCPQCGHRDVGVSLCDDHRRSGAAMSAGESSGGGWDLLRVAGLCWLLSQPIVLLGLSLVMGWYLVTATREVVDDELGR